jgi:hypothetical protein
MIYHDLWHPEKTWHDLTIFLFFPVIAITTPRPPKGHVPLGPLDLDESEWHERILNLFKTMWIIMYYN